MSTALVRVDDESTGSATQQADEISPFACGRKAVRVIRRRPSALSDLSQGLCDHSEACRPDRTRRLGGRTIVYGAMMKRASAGFGATAIRLGKAKLQGASVSGLTAAMLLFQPGAADADASLAATERLVDRFRAVGRFDRATVERRIGAKLRRSSENQDVRFYRRRRLRFGSLTVDVELREPAPGGDAAVGPMLIVRVRSGCAPRRAVQARYGPWTIANIPHGQSWNEEASWSRRERWGKLSFGFAERAPDCLSTIVFDAAGYAKE